MPKSFNFNAAPFDGLNAEQQQWVRDAVDIGYYPAGEVILAPGAEPAHLFVIIKGHVKQTEHDEVICVFGKDECFDGRGLISGSVAGTFTAAEELLVYLLPKATVKRLIAANAVFGALLFSDISQKLKALSERQTQRELHSLMMARLDQAYLRPPCFVAENTSVYEVAHLLEERNLSHVLVKGGAERVGIFTTTDIRRAILADRNSRAIPVGELASWSLIEVDQGDAVFDALILMIRHGVHRIVVKKDNKIIGVLEQLDLLSFISNHSHLIWLQIQQAASIEELKQASFNIQRLIQLLSDSGVKVNMIAQLVSELNAKIFTRLWQFIAPVDLIENSCVIVMGSEGRGEQILKTDQDNGLILRNGYHHPQLSALTAAFNDALCDFGYPPCMGGIMMRNPLWCQNLDDFKDTLRQWILYPSMETLMRLAVFSDAEAVCGDRELLASLKDYFHRMLQEAPNFYPHFAQAADTISEQSSWWAKLLGGAGESETLDIKKLGVFPIVHGIRSMALESRVEANSTQERIEALVRMRKLDEGMASDLVESLNFLMEIRLRQGLASMALGQRPDNQVRLDLLSTLERELVRDSLQLVKRFRSVLRYHFKLDLL